MPNETIELEERVQELFGLLDLETEEKRNELRNLAQESSVEPNLHYFIEISSKVESCQSEEEKNA